MKKQLDSSNAVADVDTTTTKDTHKASTGLFVASNAYEMSDEEGEDSDDSDSRDSSSSASEDEYGDDIEGGARSNAVGVATDAEDFEAEGGAVEMGNDSNKEDALPNTNADEDGEESYNDSDGEDDVSLQDDEDALYEREYRDGMANMENEEYDSSDSESLASEKRDTKTAGNE